jgi:2-C-methyl-D-erythritol 4-phosphate cytidylyltransferase
MKNVAIILASGSGSRFNNEIPKQFYKINNKTVLEYSIEAFQSNLSINEIIIVTNPDFIEETKNITNKYTKVIKVISGGETRQISSYNGVFAVDDDNSNVLIHDAARPFINQNIIDECINALCNYKAVNVAVESSDTIIEVDEDNFIKSVPERKSLRRCQTPQCFNTNVIKTAHKLALNDNFNSATDDCSLILKYNICPIKVVSGDINNIKITYPSDLVIAEKILKNN